MMICNKKSFFFVTIILLSLLQGVQGQDNTHFDFSLGIEHSEINMISGDSGHSTIFINLTSNLSKNVNISGEWVSTHPENISVILSKENGTPPFLSNITFNSSGMERGSFQYMITAVGENVDHYSNITLNVRSDNISLETDGDNYTQGENIHISGNLISNFHSNTIFSKNVKITLKHENWQRYLTTELQNNSYNYNYTISYGDPQGVWNLTAEHTDENGFTISNYKKINVTIPTDTVRYKVVWYSPARNSIYQKGSTFDISVFVTEDDEAVKNASTNCIIPPMERINLTEIKTGYYQESYTIPWSSESGIWTLSLECITGNGSSLKSGGSSTSITIKPTKIDLKLIEPHSNQYNYGEKIEIKVNLSYSDGTPLNNATVKATILGENLSFSDIKNGSYSTEYTILDENKGSFVIQISAIDPYDNYASETKIIQIIHRKESSFPIFTVIGFFILCVIAFFVFSYLRKRFSIIHLQDINQEIEEVQRLQNEAAEKYYKKSSISRKTYDQLRKEHSERLAELKKDIEKKKKFKKISKTKKV